MKALKRVLAVGLVSLAWTVPCVAQSTGMPVGGPISTGRVTMLDSHRGVMTIRSDSTGRSLTFYGMEGARVENSAGTETGFYGIQPNMNVTVEYTPARGRWYVGRVLIPAPPVVAAPPRYRSDLTPGELRALRSRAFNDNDITTQPGIRARISNDITYQPGKKDAYDNDITKKSDRYYSH